MLSFQMESSFLGFTTGFLEGSGLDFGPSPSIPTPFSPTSFLPPLGQAQTRLHHAWGEKEGWEVPAATLAAG